MVQGENSPELRISTGPANRVGCAGMRGEGCLSAFCLDPGTDIYHDSVAWSASINATLIGGAAPLIVFGGNTGSGSFRTDTWSLSLNGSPTWTQLSPAGPFSPARSGCAAVDDPVIGPPYRGGFFMTSSRCSAASMACWALSMRAQPLLVRLVRMAPRYFSNATDEFRSGSRY